MRARKEAVAAALRTGARRRRRYSNTRYSKRPAFSAYLRTGEHVRIEAVPALGVDAVFKGERTCAQQLHFHL